MTNAVSLQATAHKFLAEKYKGISVESFTSLVNDGLQRSGVPIDAQNKRQNIQAYLNLVNFETIFVDTLNNLLIDKWSATSETWRIWVNNYSLTDFKPTAVTAVGVIPKPELIPVSGTYKRTDLHGEVAFAKLETYGNLINIERQTVFSDDISAINSILAGIASAYDRQIGDKIYGLLTENPQAFGETPIFDSAHKNQVATSNDFTTDLGSALALMYGQTIDINAADKEEVRIQPKYVIVPPEKALAAAKVVGEYNKAVTEQQLLVVIVESRLTGFDGWFLGCDNPFASISLFTLKGALVPQIFTSNVFNSDGLQVKHRLDYDVRPTDYRGLVRVN
ncbi:MAG: Clp protease [Alteromonas stellipolaris]|uniref:phage major capsid protein n=1 Tax=Alteromonas stellipolaris TaxID=233316 RepID=UPI003B8CAD45